MNIFFKHKEIHNFIWEARGYKSIIEHCKWYICTHKH